jgi:MFS family permease
VIKDSPESVGQEIDGGERVASGESGDARPPALNAQLGARNAQLVQTDERDWRVGEAARTIAFWAIAICFHLTMMAQGGFLIHQVLILAPTFGFVAAATVVSVTTIMGAVGRAAFTVVGSRWPSRRIAAAMFVLQAVGLALSAAGGAVGDGAAWVLVVGSIAFGLTMGIIVSIQPVVVADCFGRRAFGRVYGPIYLAIQLGTGFGSLVFGLTATAFGSYGPVLSVVAVTLLLAAFGMRWAVPPRSSDAAP